MTATEAPSGQDGPAAPEKSGVSHTDIGKDFNAEAAEFILVSDIWVTGKDYKWLELKLAALLEKTYNEGKTAQLRDFVKVAIEERTRK